MKLASWNVNGLRASWDKGLHNYIKMQKPDALCLQEIKVLESQLTEEQKNPFKYQSIWYPAQKPGYSGVATYTVIEPLSIIKGIGHKVSDDEGRVLTLEFKNFFLVNAYFPNSQRDHARLGYKIEFCEKIHKFLKGLVKEKKGVIICGDFNIAHREIDLKNPKSNKNNAGFLPEERAWMDEFLENNFIDAFREFEKEGNHYTWWSYRPGVREKNVGWRIDYHCFNKQFRDNIKSATILPQIMGSDHCPIELMINVKGK